jgi:VIT1/CCC1 family predicted Fe2+/Mn2+ transporter
MTEGAWNLGALPWSQLGATGLLAIAVGLILGGWLVPRRALKDAQKERDKWEALAKLSQSTERELVEQVVILVEVGRTTEALMRSIVTAADRPRDKDPA